MNGTLVLPLKTDKPHDYRPIPRVGEAVAMLCDAGFVCPVSRDATSLPVWRRILAGGNAEAAGKCSM